MSRRNRAQKRPVPPDSVYNSRLISMAIRRIMQSGKKSIASGLLYDSLKVIEERTGQDPLEVLRTPYARPLP